MISFKENDLGYEVRLEFINIQGMDILFILNNYPTEILREYLTLETVQFLRKIERSINNPKGMNREALLRKSYQLEASTYEDLATFLKLLINEEVLFVRETLMSYPLEMFDVNINQSEDIHRLAKSINPIQINPYYEYKLNSCKFGKFVSEQITYCNYIMGVLDSGLANEKKALNELNKIKKRLKTMGYDFEVVSKDSDEKTISTDKKRIVLFFCDIMGTIDAAESCDYELLAEKLEQLKEKNKADEVIFSLITGDSCRNYLIDQFNDIKTHLYGNDIIPGTQFMSGYSYCPHAKEFTDDTRRRKFKKILEYTAELAEDNDIVYVYYTDDRPDFGPEDIVEDLAAQNYCFLGFNYSKPSFDTDMVKAAEANINGVIEAIDYHLNPELLHEQNRSSYQDENDRDLPF